MSNDSCEALMECRQVCVENYYDESRVSIYEGYMRCRLSWYKWGIDELKTVQMWAVWVHMRDYWGIRCVCICGLCGGLMRCTMQRNL